MHVCAYIHVHKYTPASTEIIQRHIRRTHQIGNIKDSFVSHHVYSEVIYNLDIISKIKPLQRPIKSQAKADMLV